MAMSYGFLNRLRTALRAKPEDGLTNILADLAVGHPDDRLETLDPLRAKLGKPVNMDGEEQLEYGWYLNRGQKLVRQEDWDKLGQEIRQFDEMRATTSGGSPIAEILTQTYGCSCCGSSACRRHYFCNCCRRPPIRRSKKSTFKQRR